MSLFDADVPPGFRYRDDFLSADAAAALAGEIAQLDFSTFEMRGVVARRRVAFFGRTYDTGGARLSPLPAFLMPLRDRVAEWAKSLGGPIVELESAHDAMVTAPGALARLLQEGV